MSAEGDGDGGERIPQIAREEWCQEPQCEMGYQLRRVSVSDSAWWVIGSMHEGLEQFEERFVFGMVRVCAQRAGLVGRDVQR